MLFKNGRNNFFFKSEVGLLSINRKSKHVFNYSNLFILPEVTKFVISDIETLQLYVKVLWLGPNLQDVTRKMMQSKISNVVMLSWTPSIITAAGSFVSVAFPPCEPGERLSVGCHYQSQRLIKLASRALEYGAPSAYDVSSNSKILFSVIN